MELPAGVGGALAFVLGACIGSFVNVVAFRLPRELSIVRPGSFCPRCERPIPAWANIPIIAFIGLRGRCLMCRQPIPFRYFLTEVSLAVAALYLYLSFPLPDALARFVFCAALFVASLIDFDWRIIPDAISLPGIPLGILATTFLVPEIGWRGSLLGIAVGGGFLFALGEAYRLLRHREGMGMGDVKLMAMVGAFLGWPGVLFTLFVGSLLGSFGGILVGLVGPRRAEPVTEGESASSLTGGPLPDEIGEADEEVSILQVTVPFGPFLSMAAGIYTLFQPQLTHWYLSG
jgi:leader peptidase (prepilin peptidase)/N-methyltransferase